MLKPILVQKLDAVKRIKIGSLRSEKSNISVRVSAVSLEQGIQPQTVLFPPSYSLHSCLDFEPLISINWTDSSGCFKSCGSHGLDLEN